jgi:hypothetical protein
MRILCLSDIHGHLDALAAVLAAAERRAWTKLLVAGDIVFPGPEPLETWRRLVSAGAVMVQGVSDKAIVTLDPDDIVAGYEQVAGPVDPQRLTYFVALACATRSVMVVNGAAAWIDGLVRSPANAALGLDLLALDLARGARAAGWGDLPPSDGRAPDYPLRPDAAETAGGVGLWLLEELAPAIEDRRRRQMTKRAAALLAVTAARTPAAPGLDPEAAEADAVAAELRGGEPSIRRALLTDLAREVDRLGPISRLHGHPAPVRTGETR